MTDRMQATLKLVRADTERVLGPDRANGLFTDLLAKWGPILGPILIRWILSKVGSNAGATYRVAALPVDATILRGWVADIMVAHKEELLSYIDSELDHRFDDVVALVRGEPPTTTGTTVAQ